MGIQWPPQSHVGISAFCICITKLALTGIVYCVSFALAAASSQRHSFRVGGADEGGWVAFIYQVCFRFFEKFRRAVAIASALGTRLRDNQQGRKEKKRGGKTSSLAANYADLSHTEGPVSTRRARVAFNAQLNSPAVALARGL